MIPRSNFDAEYTTKQLGPFAEKRCRPTIGQSNSAVQNCQKISEKKCGVRINMHEPVKKILANPQARNFVANFHALWATADSRAICFLFPPRDIYAKSDRESIKGGGRERDREGDVLLLKWGLININRTYINECEWNGLIIEVPTTPASPKVESFIHIS